MEEDEEPLSQQLRLPEIDMSSKARFQRSRERRIGLVLALIEKVLLKETMNGLHPEDMAEAARRLPSIVEKIANKRASMLNVEKSAAKRRRTAEKKWQSHAEDRSCEANQGEGPKKVSGKSCRRNRIALGAALRRSAGPSDFGSIYFEAGEGRSPTGHVAHSASATSCTEAAQAERPA